MISFMLAVIQAGTMLGFFVGLFQECLTSVKEYSDYIYGGAWKARKG